MRTAESKEVTRCLAEKLLGKHGLPSVILTDQGRNLGVGHIIKNLYNVLGINKKRSSSLVDSIPRVTLACSAKIKI